MKKIIIISVVSILISSSVFASPFIQHCSNTGSSGVSFSFEGCINNNFREIDREFGYMLHLRFCDNIGDHVSSIFINCINDNFREIDREFNYTLYLSHCYNFGDNLSYSFENCVNRNFRDIFQEID